LRDVKLGNGLTVIGRLAFSDCSALVKLVLPDEVQEIGDEAFSKCTNLKEVKLGNGLSDVGRGAFSGCSSLTAVVLPDGLTKIGQGVFSQCTQLKEVSIGRAAALMPDMALWFCRSQTGYFASERDPSVSPNVIVRRSVEETVLVLDRCDFGEETIVGADVVSQGLGERRVWEIVHIQLVGKWREWAGKGPMNWPSLCGFWTELEVFDCSQSQLESIGNGAFENSKKLKVVKLGMELMVIGDSAFSGCSALTELVLPDGVRKVGNGALGFCISLSTLSIGRVAAGLPNRREWFRCPSFWGGGFSGDVMDSVRIIERP
jgi:hypothetical protein